MVKVSVVVPIYKVEAYLPKCIQSLCDQTLKEIEIILVDDGSPDKSGKICDEFAAKDNRIRVIHKTNGGVGAARNDGLAIATGEYIIFVDSDDYIPLDAYEKLYARAKKDDVDIVLADLYLDKDGKLEYARFFSEPFLTSDRAFLDELIKADFFRTYCPNPPISGPAFGYGGPTTKLVKRSMLLENDIQFDVSVKGIFDDIIYTAYIFAVARNVAYISEPVYYYRLLDTSITQTYKANMPEINSAIFASWEKFMNKYGSDGRFEKAYYANVFRRLEQSMTKYFFCSNNPRTRKEVLRELKQTLKMEPYKTAIKKVEFRKLTRRYKLLAILARTKITSLFWLLYCDNKK